MKNIFSHTCGIATGAAVFLCVGVVSVFAVADTAPQQKVVVTDFSPVWRDGRVEASVQVRNVSGVALDVFPRMIVQAPAKETMEDGALIIGAPVHIWTEESTSLNILAGQKKQIDFSFYLSSHLDSGEYELFMQILAPDGSVLAGAMSKIRVKGDGHLLDVSQKHCKMVHAPSSFERTLFDPQEAPPYPAGTAPTALCTVKNTAHARVAGQLRLRVNEFAAFGYYLHEPEVILGEIYNFAPGEEREISIALPSKIKPQVYEAAMQFVSVENPDDRLSALAPLRWTIQGEAARISSWSVDKETYLDGGKSQIDLTVSYYASPDLFWGESPTREEGRVQGTPLSRAALVVEARAMRGDKGVLCAREQYNLASASTPDLQTKKVSIRTNGCTSPELTLQIVSDGKVLSSVVVSGTPLAVAQVKSSSQQSTRLILLTVGILMLGILYVAGVSRRKHENI
jgi:hypothetical protein